MTTEEAERRYQRIHDLGMAMRHYQKRWVRFRIGNEKELMLKYQREFDRVLEVENKRKRSLQKEIF